MTPPSFSIVSRDRELHCSLSLSERFDKCVPVREFDGVKQVRCLRKTSFYDFVRIRLGGLSLEHDGLLTVNDSIDGIRLLLSRRSTVFLYLDVQFTGLASDRRNYDNRPNL